ncbi:MAG: GIY-YIG nuclease family protein [Saprospiraceae bacterium]|nr:GIY-YIG nuclease family protein [Saprospiraceae bacterium]MBP6695673.1 GIY-YIG nuclease family protein [Saprospiraceae bacterium]
MAFAYILFSNHLNRFYIGCTTDSVENRLTKHNQSFFGVKAFTSKSSDWNIVWKVETDSIEHARKIEKKIKAMKSTVFIRNLISYPELTLKIFKETLR